METILIILGVIVAIALIVGAYYLFKILLGYIGFIVIFGVIFGVIGAIVGKYISVDSMWYFMLYGAIGGGIVGLIFAIMRTSAFAKGHLATEMYKDLVEGDPIGTEYTAKDQYGNTVRVKKTGQGMLGESFLEDSNGNHYEGHNGNSEIKRV